MQEKVIPGKPAICFSPPVFLRYKKTGRIVNQVQHFLLKFQLEFSNQDIFWDGY